MAELLLGVGGGDAEAQASGALGDGGEHDRCGDDAEVAQAAGEEGGGVLVLEDDGDNGGGGEAGVVAEALEAVPEVVGVLLDAADALGLDLERMEFKAGTSDLPDAGIAGGSAHTATAGMAIHNAGAAVIAKLADLATNDQRSPLFGAGNEGVIARDGRLFRRDDETRSDSYADILGRAGLAQVEARGKGAADPAAQSSYAMHAHGAVFAEVKVDPDLGQIRVTRLVGAFAAGRVINPRMVRSQIFGGMIWGMSFALHEQAIMDKRSGRTLNANFAEYQVPVNADVPSMEALMIEEHDPHVNALGIKGVGEIGITGSAGAIANAVWHATGVRVRRFPIGLDDLVMPRSH